MKFNKNTNDFFLKYVYFLFLILLAYLSYFVFEHPDVEPEKRNYLYRLLAYYTAPYVILLSILCPIYLWFKYRTLEVNLVERVIRLNNKSIDISAVNEIYIQYVAINSSYEYIFSEVAPMAHRKIFVIPMFFIPDSKSAFDNELNEFCVKNKVKRVNSKID